jgi:hypothetical protein
MGSIRATAGRCPACDSTITRQDILIEYETGGDVDAFAECPDCLRVVHPTVDRRS